MKYKLIASDIDGTLLRTDKTISPRTLNAIRNAMDKGAVFAVSSGRAVHFCRLFEELTGLKDVPFILYNGARILTGPEHTVTFRQELAPSVALWLAKAGIEAGTTVIVWSDDTLYVNELNERTERDKTLSLGPPKVFTDPFEVTKNGASKVLWFDEIDRASYLKDILEASPIRDKINYFTSDPRFMEIVDASCSKALALDKLCKMYGIAQEETIAFGDGYNDLPMIEWAGTGVAMANAPEEIKNKADLVTLSNDEDGVAVILERYFQ